MSSGGRKSEIFKSDIEKGSTLLTRVVDIRTILTLRSDLSDLYSKYADLSDVSRFQKREWTSIGRRGLDETEWKYATVERLTGVLGLADWLITFLLWITLTHLSQFLGVGQIPSLIISALIAIFLHLMNKGLLVAKPLLREVSFRKDQFHPRMAPTKLRFRAGWNKGVIQSSVSLVGLILVGIWSGPDSRRYKLAVRFIEEWIRFKYAS
jgi:hypothetical protein